MQWRTAKAEEAFYNRTNQVAARKPQQQGQGYGSSQQNARPYFRSNAPTFPVRPTAPAQPAAPRDPNAMDVDAGRQQQQQQQQQVRRPQIKCFKCNGLGHMARDCRSKLDIRAMTYEEMREHFEQAEAARKDREEIRR